MKKNKFKIKVTPSEAFEVGRIEGQKIAYSKILAVLPVTYQGLFRKLLEHELKSLNIIKLDNAFKDLGKS